MKDNLIKSSKKKLSIKLYKYIPQTNFKSLNSQNIPFKRKYWKLTLKKYFS